MPEVTASPAGFAPVTVPVPGAAVPSAAVPSAAVPSVAVPPAPVNPAPVTTTPVTVPVHHRSLIWGVPFDHVTMQQAIDTIDAMVRRGEPSYVITANLNYAMLNHQRDDMRPVTADAGLILADGQPIVWRSQCGGKALPQRVAGSEMIYGLAQRAAQNGWGIYFLGGEPGVAAACADRLAHQFPGLKIAGVESPPFRALTDDEQAAQDERIKTSGAQILLVAFGQPKGELWIHQHHRRLGVPVSIQLGASFDFVAGLAHRAPASWQRFGMEWAFRMLTDPKRLVPRYAANAGFLLSALVEDWKQLVVRWGMWTPTRR
jgi:N-acetylglucosaminyldiphosphoundecaprenol N-acetyl-beta-D-mannosaminyltransferase